MTVLGIINVEIVTSIHKAMPVELVKAAVLRIVLELCNALFQYL